MRARPGGLAGDRLGQILDTPWKIANEVECWLVWPIVRLLFALNGIPWGRDWRCYGLPVVQKHRRSVMRFGPGMQLRSSVRSNPLAPYHPVVISTREPGAVLEAGANLRVTGGSLCAANRITIGNNVVIGANTIIADTDFHPVDPRERWIKPSEGGAEPIVIEDNVFIGMNCLILKGVRLGQNSVIGAGSVVASDVAPFTIVAGNPARLVRRIESEVAP